MATDSSDDVHEYTDVYANVVCSDEQVLVRQWIIEPGTITEDANWNGLLKVNGHVTIASGVTITIESGSIVKFPTSSGQLDVQGTLLAQGTLEDPIVFSSWKDDIKVARLVTDELIENLKKRPEAILRVHYRQFEELVAKLLEGLGWRVDLTPKTKDGGYDLFAISRDDLVGVETSWIIECKNYAQERKVGVEIV